MVLNYLLILISPKMDLKKLALADLHDEKSNYC